MIKEIYMQYFVISILHLILFVTRGSSTDPIWISNIAINNGKIIFANYNSTTTTIWKIKNGQTTLTPCRFDFPKKSCTDFYLSTTLNYNDVSCIKEKYDPATNITSYLFEGARGELCFIFPTSTKCFKDEDLENAFKVRYGFG